MKVTENEMYVLLFMHRKHSKETVSEDQTVKNNKLLREQSGRVKRVPAWEAEIIEKKQKEYAIKQARKAAYCSNVEVFGLIKKSEKNLVMRYRVVINIFFKFSQINEQFITVTATLTISPLGLLLE